MAEPEKLPTPLEKAVACRAKLQKQINDIDCFIKIHKELESQILAESKGAEPPKEQS